MLVSVTSIITLSRTLSVTRIIPPSTMQILIIISLVMTLALAAPSEDAGFYNSKYDDFDTESLTTNLRLLKSYCQCFLDKGPCTSEGKDIKAVLPEAVATTCGKCSPKQRILVRKVINAMKEKIPENWEALKKTFDPTGEHQESLDKFLSSED